MTGVRLSAGDRRGGSNYLSPTSLNVSEPIRTRPPSYALITTSQSPSHVPINHLKSPLLQRIWIPAHWHKVCKTGCGRASRAPNRSSPGRVRAVAIEEVAACVDDLAAVSVEHRLLREDGQ